MTQINGYKNETEFVTYLNQRKVRNCHLLFQELIYKLYPNVGDEMTIKCWKNPNLQKTDFYMKINNITKRISLKMGMKNSVHTEPISEFIHFLIINEVPRNCVISYLRYHYGDGTTNGTGEHRLSALEYKEQHQNEIDNLNKILNQKNILKKAVNRFVLQGRNDRFEIDALISGTINDFIFLLKDEIEEIVIDDKEHTSTAVHFGPLICQPLTRNLNYNPKFERKRFCVQVKWYSLFDDAIKYQNKQVMKQAEK